MFFDDKMAIGRIIKKYRKQKKITQEELSEKINVSEKHLSKIETGVHLPSLEVFFNIVKFLNIPLEEFDITVTTRKKSHTEKELYKYIGVLNEEELEYLYMFITLSFNNYKIRHK